LALAAFVGFGVSFRARAEDHPLPLSERARALHASALLIDGHNDLPWVVRTEGKSRFEDYDISRRLDCGHTDIPRLRAGGVKAQFWSVYVPARLAREGSALRATIEQIDLVHRMAERYRSDLEIAYSADDVERIVRAGRIASLIGIEGGHSIEGSLGALRMLHRLGARYMTLTHSDTLEWADSATDEARHGGLSAFGEEVVREMNRLGMLVDISHVSADAMRDALRVSTAPLIASHSSAFALAPHPRNVPDDVLKLVAANGGVVMVNFYAGFIDAKAAKALAEGTEALQKLREEHKGAEAYRRAKAAWWAENVLGRGSLAQVLDHIEHIARVAGVDHVGLGSDFDGIDQTPEGLEDVSAFPRLTQGLLDRGWRDEDVLKVLGANARRVLRGAEQAARRARGN
jgi:membrane dipeptidase